MVLAVFVMCALSEGEILCEKHRYLSSASTIEQCQSTLVMSAAQVYRPGWEIEQMYCEEDK